MKIRSWYVAARGWVKVARLVGREDWLETDRLNPIVRIVAECAKQGVPYRTMRAELKLAQGYEGVKA